MASPVISSSAARQSNLVSVSGGLGNQLFQYLFGETLVERLGRPTVYDTSGYRSYELHEGFAIPKTFDVELPLLSASEQRTVMISRFPTLQRVVRRSSWAAQLLGCETDRTFRRGQGRRPKTRFVGYWQSQSYSNDEIARFCGRLRFNQAFSDQILTKLMRYGPLDKIGAVHVRRGDFLIAPPSAPQYALPLSYYEQAMSQTMAQAGVERFIVVSDDPAWVQDALAPRFPILRFDGIPNSAAADLCLLSLLKNKVLSNSTFSWWGAHLCIENGLIFAPQPWCKPSTDTAHSTPAMSSTWTLLDVAAK